MNELIYSVIPGFDHQYGIQVLHESERHCAMFMPCQCERETVDRIVASLNEKQVSISDFCDMAIEGKLYGLI